MPPDKLPIVIHTYAVKFPASSTMGNGYRDRQLLGSFGYFDHRLHRNLYFARNSAQVSDTLFPLR